MTCSSERSELANASQYSSTVTCRFIVEGKTTNPGIKTIRLEAEAGYWESWFVIPSYSANNKTKRGHKHNTDYQLIVIAYSSGFSAPIGKKNNKKEKDEKENEGTLI